MAVTIDGQAGGSVSTILGPCAIGQFCISQQLDDHIAFASDSSCCIQSFLQGQVVLIADRGCHDHGATILGNHNAHGSKVRQIDHVGQRLAAGITLCIDNRTVREISSGFIHTEVDVHLFVESNIRQFRILIETQLIIVAFSKPYQW